MPKTSVMLRNVFLLLLVAEGLCTGYNRGPVVRTGCGRYRGKALRASNGHRYNSYRGIPYAQPPVGDLRFARSVPLPPTNFGTFDATDFGPICVQPRGTPDRGQEDCLSLNVFTPRRRRREKGNLKSVMVFLHGGGAVSGSSKDYLPGDLVTQGDIIVVTLNFRQGWLGYLRGLPPDIAGNQALGDIVLALNWVKSNIRAFGGDPNDVTLSGQSEGSNAATLLSFSPATKDLFNKVILLTKADLEFPSPPVTSQDLLDIAKPLFGCASATSELETIQCLKDQPALNFDTQYSVGLAQAFLSSGDDLFPRPTPLLVNNQSYLADVGFLSRIYLLEVIKDFGFQFIESNNLPTGSDNETVEGILNLIDLPRQFVIGQLDRYRSLNDGDNKKALSAFLFELLVLQGYSFFETGAVGYFMSFDHEPTYIEDSLMLQGLDLSYLFDIEPSRVLELFYTSYSTQGSFTRLDELLKEAFIKLISDFVKTGDPGVTLADRYNINWPQFRPTSGADFYLSYSTSSSVRQELISRGLSSA